MIETGNTLKLLRKNSGISLEEVSRDIEIPVIYLEQLEAGRVGSFENIYKVKEMLISYAKYLGLDTKDITNKFNEYMFEYTSKIQLDEIEKAIKEHEKEMDEEERVYSPYTKAVIREKTLPYVLTFIGIVFLVLIALIWSVKQITVNNVTTNEISYVE